MNLRTLRVALGISQSRLSLGFQSQASARVTQWMNGAFPSYASQKLVVEAAMVDRLTEELARRVMGWRVCPDRYLKSGRDWVPRWRFQPLERIEDAFALLDQSSSQYKIERAGDGQFRVRVQIGRQVGRASGEGKASAICLALAQALQLDVSGHQRPKSELPTSSRGGRRLN